MINNLYAFTSGVQNVTMIEKWATMEINSSCWGVCLSDINERVLDGIGMVYYRSIWA